MCVSLILVVGGVDTCQKDGWCYTTGDSCDDASADYYDEDFDGATGDEIKSSITANFRGGGTTLSSVANYLVKNYDDPPQAIVYFTDGYIESTPKLIDEAENIYLIVEGGTEHITSQLPGRSFKISD